MNSHVADAASQAEEPAEGGQPPAEAADPCIEEIEAELSQCYLERKRTTADRLSTIVAELVHADDALAPALLEEAERLVHQLAGTAGMFDEPWISEQAREVEALCQMASNRDDAHPLTREPALASLVAALRAG